MKLSEIPSTTPSITHLIGCTRVTLGVPFAVLETISNLFLQGTPEALQKAEALALARRAYTDRGILPPVLREIHINFPLGFGRVILETAQGSAVLDISGIDVLPDSGLITHLVSAYEVAGSPVALARWFEGPYILGSFKQPLHN